MLLLFFLLIVLLCLSFASLAIGARDTGILTVWHVLSGRESNADTALILDRRLPRTLHAISAGVALSVAGCLLQQITRNPLADTGVFGINFGAALAAALAISLLGWTSPTAFALAALAGAAATMALVIRLGQDRLGRVRPLHIVLAGVAISAVCEGIGEGLALVDPQAFARIRAWLVGDLDIANLQPLWLIGAGLIASALFLLPRLNHLPALALGDETAAALGVNVHRTRLALLIAVTLLAAATTAAVGVISFLGLVVPRLIILAGVVDEKSQLLLSAALGPCLLLTADVLGRVIVPGEMPAGVVVTFIGAPFLIALALKSRVVG